MENHIQNIELINNYLNKTLSQIDSQNFENRLKTDSEFNTLYEEHTTFLVGLKRQQLKMYILKAKQSYIKTKWLKFFGVSLVVLTIVAVAFVLISNKSTETFQNNKHENNSSIVDTIPSEKKVEVSSEIDEPIIVNDSIQSKNEIVQSKTIKNIETSFKKTPQKLKINTQKDTVIVCKEGTKLTIKAYSFIDKIGNIEKGLIDLNVTEYYKLSDLLLANLSTTSNGKKLETGGMLYLEAFRKEEVLSLKQNSSIEISFPTEYKKEGMQMFSGEWENGIMNWNLQNEPLTETVIIDVEIKEANVEVPFAVVEEAPIYPGCENGNNAQRKNCMSDEINKFVLRNFNIGIPESLGFNGRQRINVIFKINQNGNVYSIRSRGPHPKIEEETNRVIALLPKMKPGKQRGKVVTVPYSLPIVFTISEDSRIFNGSIPINNQIEMDTIYTDLRGDVEHIKQVMHDNSFNVDSAFVKTWKTYIKQKQIRIIGEGNNQTAILRKPLFETENTRFKILEDDSISRGGHIIRKLWKESQVPTVTRNMRLVPKEVIYAGKEKVTVKAFESRLQDKEDRTITAYDVNNYVLRTSSLGWLNCDRFINRNAKRIKYKIKVNDTNGAIVSMVFKSVNSVLPSWKTNGNYDFGTVVKDEEVTLVAINKQKGKLFLDIIDTKTEENPKLDFNFKEVSLEEMKNELQKLNKRFW